MSSSMSVLELPVGAHPDPDEFVQEAMAWHFDPSTGSPFWLERARSLDFDPRNDVRTFGDLALFPNVTDELRDVPVRDLIPKGFGDRPDIVGVIESGGTTGPPKRLPLLREFSDRVTSSNVASLERAGASKRDWLLCMPGGPHTAFEQHKRAATAWGVLTFGIDMDPRWVKKCLSEGRRGEAEAYAEHLVDQIEAVLRSQDVGRIGCTPPVLVRIAGRDDLVEIIRRSVESIGWGGASMDADTRALFRNEVFPGIQLDGGYGTTMALGGTSANERPGLIDDDPCIFDPSISPHVTFSVVNPETMRPVAYNERGRLLVNHLSKSFLLPNNLERDYATRVEPVHEQVGDSFADVAPVADFKGAQVIEGVY